MSQSKLLEDQKSVPVLGVGGTGLYRENVGALQQKHLQHIVGAGRNSMQVGNDEANQNGRANNLL